MSVTKPEEPARPRRSSRRAAVRLIRWKVLGALVCAVVGVGCGWVYSQNGDADHSVKRYLIVGGLGGATAGGLLAGGRFGRVGIGILIGLTVGLLFEEQKFSGRGGPTRDPVWSVASYLVGFAVGTIAEYVGSRPDGGPSALREGDPGW
jgi:hypothetical protein